MQQKTKFHTTVFCFYLLVCFSLYFITRNAGFVDDYIGFEANYDRCGLLHYYSCSGSTNLRFFQHVFTFALYRLFGSEHIAWYVVYCILHTVAAYLSFVVLRKLLKIFEQQNPTEIAFFAALLFLISPYQTEVVIWRVCIQYMVVHICMLLSVLLILQEHKNYFFTSLLIGIILFIVALFSIEQAIMIPFVLLAIVFILFIGKKDFFDKKFVATLFVSQLFVIAIFFSLSKIIYHKWIMHYGSQVFTNFISIDTFSRFFKYFLKYIFLLRQWNYNTANSIYEFICKPVVFYSLLILLIVSCDYACKKYLTRNLRFGFILLMILMYAISLFPVLQLYFSTLLLVEGDRLGYISSVFIFAIFIFFIYQFHKTIARVIVIVFVCLNLFFLIQTNKDWNLSQQILTSYNNSYQFKARKIFVLATPENYKGIYLIRTKAGLAEILKYRANKIIQQDFIDVVHFNQCSFNDGIKVEKENDSTLIIGFTKTGNWFWRDALGASDYSNQDFKYRTADWNSKVTLRNFDPKQDIIIYPDSSKWKQFVW